MDHHTITNITGMMVTARIIPLLLLFSVAVVHALNSNNGRPQPKLKNLVPPLAHSEGRNINSVTRRQIVSQLVFGGVITPFVLQQQPTNAIDDSAYIVQPLTNAKVVVPKPPSPPTAPTEPETPVVAEATPAEETAAVSDDESISEEIHKQEERVAMSYDVYNIIPDASESLDPRLEKVSVSKRIFKQLEIEFSF